MNSPKIKINDQEELRTTLLEAFNKITHYQAVKWTKYLIDEVKDLCNFEKEVAKLIEQSLDYINKFSSQFNEFKAVRSLAFRIHALARQEESLKNTIGLRTVSQALSTIHAKDHAIIASDYLIKLINIIYPNDSETVRRIRLKQIEIIKKL